MTDPDQLKERLAENATAFSEASAEGGGYVKNWPPDGTYQALVRKFDFFDSDKTGDTFLKTELEIAHDREHKGKGVETIHNLTDPEKMDWLKTHLDRLGVDVNTLELTDIYPGSEIFEQLYDVPVELAIKTADKKDPDGNNYRNAYVNKRLGDPLNPGVVGGPMVGGKVQSDVPADSEGLTPEQVKADAEIPF